MPASLALVKTCWDGTERQAAIVALLVNVLLLASAAAVVALTIPKTPRAD
ncbi:hypothetical protein ACW5F0_04125 [Luteimonas sp. A534]